MSRTKADQAAMIALEAIHDAAPAILTMTEVAEKVAGNGGVTTSTARNWLRAAVEAGDLLELTPRSRKFFIDLPGAEAAGLGPFYVVQKWTGQSRDFHREISTDDGAQRPSSYGPGRTTYVVDPKQMREYVQSLADEKKAKEEADREAAKAEQEAAKREFRRRFPGLLHNLRRFRLLGTEIREPRGRFAMVRSNTYLEDTDRRGKEAMTVEERDASVTVHAYGNENVALLHSILDAGIAVHVESQPVTYCAHCAGRILQVPQGGDGGFWWHLATTNASCGKDTDTKAEPADEAETKD